MILKGSQRGGGRQLAAHLLNAKENEHVTLHELRGFTANDLPGAFQEAFVTSKATKAKQYLFSLSLNPPPDAKVRAETFEAAIATIEKRMGLDNQPRAIVFHEKDGRRHAHAVWSRIDTENMRAVPLPFYKTRLREVARELYIENGWKMPHGFIDSKERDPANYTLAEWQQAKRAGVDPKALKSMFQELWAASDSGKAFAAALKSRGYTLAGGDRRGHVAVDYRGEVYAIARTTGQKTKDVRSRLGDEKALPSVDEAKADHASRMTDMLRRHIKDAEDRRRTETEKLAARRKETVERQRQQRAELQKQQQTRLATETRERTQRFSRGFRGLWDRLTGKHTKIKQQNEREAQLSQQRDKDERDKLTFRQLDERQSLHRQIRQQRQLHRQQVAELHRDVADFSRVPSREPPKVKELFNQRANQKPEYARTRQRDRDRGPNFER
jgi:hypothetical protein